jgi:intraflagellar transport protein 122
MQTKTLNYNPIFIKWLSSSNFFVITGTNNQAQLLSRQGNFIYTIANSSSWIWQVDILQDEKFGVVSDDGEISMFQLSQSKIYSFQKEVYACRDNLTDILVQNLVTDKKVRIKCKEAVNLISIYKERLAVMMNGFINVYFGSVDDLRFKLQKVINYTDQCDFLAVSIFSVFVCHS